MLFRSYPDSAPDDWEQDFRNNRCSSWLREGEMVRIAEYWRKVPLKRHIALMQDGSRLLWEDVDPNQYDQVVDTAETQSYKITRTLMSGAGIIEDEKDFPGEFIPVVPVFGLRSL